MCYMWKLDNGTHKSECTAGPTDDRSRGNIFINKYTIYCVFFVCFFLITDIMCNIRKKRVIIHVPSTLSWPSIGG